jgi:hypothetical protein
MRLITEKVFLDGLWHGRQMFENLTFENCTFDSWAGLMPDWDNPDPRLRPTVRNVVLRNTAAYNAYLDGAILENITVDTTKAGKAPLFLRGNVYNRVSLEGRIGYMEIRGKMFPPTQFSAEWQAEIIKIWDDANQAYYEHVDWALDIRKASYGSLSITGVPTKLIKRHAENTAVVTRARALNPVWRDLPYKWGVQKVAISWFLDDGYDDVLLIACPRSKRFKDDLEDIRMLRDAGIAE